MLCRHYLLIEESPCRNLEVVQRIRCTTIPGQKCMSSLSVFFAIPLLDVDTMTLEQKSEA